jgi:hypothetical protein
MNEPFDFPEDYDSWDRQQQTSWKMDQAKRQLGIVDDTAPIVERVSDAVAPRVDASSRRNRQEAARAGMGHEVSDPTQDATPLSREAHAMLANYGYGGLGFKTYGEALGHVRGTAQYLGLHAGSGKDLGSRRGLSDDAERAGAMVADESAIARGHTVAGNHARLVDELHTLHLGMVSQMQRSYTGYGTGSYVNPSEDINPFDNRDKATRPTVLQGGAERPNDAGDLPKDHANIIKERAVQALGEPKVASNRRKGKNASNTGRQPSDTRSTTFLMPAVPKTPLVLAPNRYELAELERHSNILKQQELIGDLADINARKRESRTGSMIGSATSSREGFSGVGVARPINAPEHMPRRLTAQEVQAQQEAQTMREQTASSEPLRMWSDKVTGGTTQEVPPTPPPNQRVDSGQPLGVQMPDGSVKPVANGRRGDFLIGGTGGRIMDRLPNTQYPVVEM